MTLSNELLNRIFSYRFLDKQQGSQPPSFITLRKDEKETRYDITYSIAKEQEESQYTCSAIIDNNDAIRIIFNTRRVEED